MTFKGEDEPYDDDDDDNKNDCSLSKTRKRWFKVNQKSLQTADTLILYT